MVELFEIIMLVCFGLSWPFNLAKSIKTKSTKGKSPIFLIFIILGYIAGIIAKFMNEAYMANFSTKFYVLFFYVINLLMVSADLIVYFINKKRENN